MGGALAAAGAAVAAALCCLAIPLTTGVIAVSDLAAFGVNLGLVAILALGMTAWIVRNRSHGEAGPSGDGDG
jgi:hypothetical protein